MSDVLIVDDEPGVREFLRHALAGAGLPCRAAASGSQALSLARSAWPAVVMLDLTLPGRLDGWATWEALDELAAGRPLRVLVFAAELDSQDRARAVERGAWRVLRKPVARGPLVEALRQALEA